MGAHVFVVDKYSYPVHRSRGFCGVKNPQNLPVRYSLYADLFAIRRGDLVFFYQRRVDEAPHLRGFRGIFETTSDAFYDTTDISWESYVVLGKCPHCGNSYSEEVEGEELKCRVCRKSLGNKHILPNRILIKVRQYYDEPVDDNTAYINHTDKGSLPTMIFRKIYGRGRERSVTHILPEEAAKLSRLLARVNYNKTSEFRSEPYPPTQRESLDIILTNINGALTYESMLEAWMMKNIDKDIPVLKEIVGNVNELEYFGNNVLYGIGGEKVDVLLVHKRRVRYKATAIELKKGKVDDSSIEQISRYSYWVAQLTTANVEPHVEELVLQPVVIGNTIEPSLVRSARRIAVRELHIPYLTAPCRVQVMPPLLTRYYVRDERMNFEILT